MGELIPNSLLNPPATLPVAPAGTPLPASGGFSINMNDVKEMLSLLRDGLKEFKEIAAMRQQLSPTPIKIGSPDPEAPPLPTPTGAHKPTTEAIMIQTKHVIDREQLKILLSDLLIKQSAKLPKEIMEMKIGEVLGENWKKFTYNYNGIIIDSEFLTNQITEQLAKQLDNMIKAEVTK